ncbi:MAG: hypothetical protein ACOY46_03310 [Bacillota bacterium]
MDPNTAAYFIRGWLGGFIAVYAVYYILNRFVFKKLEAVKAFRLSLALSFVLLLSVTDYPVKEALIFYTPGIINVYIIENFLLTRRTCPVCSGRVKKDLQLCNYCGSPLPKEKKA